MNPAEDRYDIRRRIILCNAIKDLPAVDVDIPNPSSMRHV